MWWVSAALATTYGGGDWGGADLFLVQGDTAEGVFTNVGRFVVLPGVTVPVASSLDVEAASVEIHGTLDATGGGYAAGEQGWPAHDGTGPAGGIGAEGRPPHAGGGGNGGAGGAGAAGGNCGAGYAGGPEVGDPWIALEGSGGGANYRRGGDGGAVLRLVGDDVLVGLTGVLRADGQAGGIGGFSAYDGGGGGGGAGGGIELVGTTSVHVVGTLSAVGGEGAQGYSYYGCAAGGGGGGGGGRIVVSGPFTGDTSRWSAAGGVGGPTYHGAGLGQTGGAGTIWLEDGLAATDPVVSLSGTCPGEVALDVTGASSFARLEVWRGGGAGGAALPSGACSGTASGLSAPVLVATLQADANGELSVSRTLAAQACGLSVVVVDAWTCGVSNVEVVP
ncbi:MAG: hypothetical protein KC621_26615 [Myxococcales bacterium]|nr:hypothetical protein [Myxococcales bacterium]